ncbi:MarR family winged helix-turn-helix transcriptional regulator [Neptuniibacter halophilus]|uniref:MarR family winged helix-turn-helix transcriptional regulator n=1 Tax=Neptuniibacter halophilus TaxID=651666 RepID=UPI0025731952|nr:MarR family winged helix-turn-helix transcriptional regulator [Neptuniibacter halophilus]
MWEFNTLLKLANAKVGQWVALREIRDDHYSGSRLSRSLKKLTDQNWITSKLDPDDKRDKQIRLTVKGRKRLKPFVTTEFSPNEMAACDLSQSSFEHYLTGLAALNIPSADAEGTGDWHAIETFEGGFGRSPGPFFFSGVNYADTKHILGTNGIHELSGVLKKAGFNCPDQLWAADHYRAMADMIYQRFCEKGTIDSYQVDDWFPEKNHKEKLCAYLVKLKNSLNSKQNASLNHWMEKNGLEC